MVVAGWLVVVTLGKERRRRGEEGGRRGELSTSWHQGLSELCMPKFWKVYLPWFLLEGQIVGKYVSCTDIYLEFHAQIKEQYFS